MRLRARARALRWIATTVIARPWPLVSLATLLTIACTIVSLRGLALDADYNNLLPGDNPVVAEMREILREHGGVSHLLFVIDGSNAPARAALADTLAADLRRRSELFESASSRLPVEWFRKRALLYLEPEELASIEGDIVPHREELRRFLHARAAAELIGAGCDLIDARYVDGEGELTRESDERATELLTELVELGALLADGGAGQDDDIFRAEVGRRLDRILIGGREPDVLRDERIVSTDGKALLVSAKAARSTLGEEGREFIYDTMSGARAAIARAEAAVPGPRVRVTGPIPQQELEEEIIREDFKRTGRMAAILITVLLCSALRLWIAPLLAMFPLLMSLTWTLAGVTLTFGRLNVFSVMFVAVVLGLGIDFGIHLIVRYGEERSGGKGAEEGLRGAIAATGSAVTTGAISTIMAFGALIFSRYPAFYELGWVAFAGIGLAFVAFVTVMPALLLIKDRLAARRLPRFETREMALDILGGLADAIERRTGWFAVATLIATAASLGIAAGIPLGPEDGWLRRGIEFQGDLLLAQPNTPSHRLQREVVERFDMGGEPFYLSAADLDEARRWEPVFEGLEEERVISRVVSPARLIPDGLPSRIGAGRTVRDTLYELCNRPLSFSPPAGTMSVALNRLAATVTELGDLAYLSGLESLPRESPELARRARGAADRVAPSPEIDGALREVLAQRRAEISGPAQGRPFGVDDLPDELRTRLVGESGHLLVSIYGRHNIYDDKVNSALVDRLRVHFPKLVGVPVLYADLLGLSRREGARAAKLAFGLIFVALLADLRRVGRAAITMVPLLLGISWTLGIMRALGIDFSFANVVAVPLLLGIGIDDGVHMMHRYLEEGRGRIRHVLRHTGRAVLLTSATTVIGFGVFELADHNGLESLGRVMVIGVTACFLASVTALPTLLAIGERWNAPARRSASTSAPTASDTPPA
ncbi:MAG: hypothetical protein CME06_07270 [Gemmatimonadetes bacterium]|nr:hypothetical protein [Gemmatimonadota bacterium]